MRGLLKWVIGGFALIAMLCVMGLFFGFLVLNSTVPPADNRASLDGLSEDVTVVFDANAIPHIEAETHEDAARALGYIHARDRLWQMEVLRMAGQGRLSEIFGEATVDTDIFLKTIDMASASRASFEKLLPETQAVVKAYVSGINQYFVRERGMLEPAFGPEFMILGHTPEEWQAWQSVLVIKVMGLTLGANMDKEITRFALARNGFTSKEIEDLMPYGPRDNPPPLPDLLSVYGLERIQAAAPATGVAPKLAEEGLDFDLLTGQSASNNWVISGSRTDTGKPILANDPHLGLTAPSTFYLAHLSWVAGEERRNVIGGIVPGTPFVVVGRTDDVAWGLTTTNLDAQDLFLEKLDETGERYLTEEGWKPLKKRIVEVKAGDASREMTILETRHGPLMPRTYSGIEDFLPANYGLALNWPGLAHDDTTLDSLYLDNKVRSLNEFMVAGRRTVSPMQSIVVADTKGNIGVAAIARTPKRKPGNRINGRAPVPGWMTEYHWDGFVETDEQLQVRNPTTGALTTANANFLPPNFDTHITYDWAEHFRQARVEELVLGRNEPHTVAVSQDIIADAYSPALVRLRDISQRVMKDSAGSRTEVINALAKWDGNMLVDRPEPLIMLAWFRHLNILMLEDDLGPLFGKFESGAITPLLRMLETAGARDWCDDQRSSETESCSDILAKALSAAMAELTAEFGSDWRGWKYGEAHVAYGEHRPFGQVGMLAPYFNIEVPSSGGPYTLLRAQTRFNKEKPYRSRHGAAYRAIYDLSDPDKSMFIQSTGQSGNFLSPHYDDLAKRWSEVDFLPMSTKPEDYSQGAIGTWTLRSK